MPSSGQGIRRKRDDHIETASALLAAVASGADVERARDLARQLARQVLNSAAVTLAETVLSGGATAVRAAIDLAELTLAPAPGARVAPTDAGTVAPWVHEAALNLLLGPQ